MDLDSLKRNWESLGREDPMWAILSDPNQFGNKWDRDAFFATGREHVDNAMTRLDTLGIKPATGKALDFGCGLGRLTQALADRFEAVDGVDIAGSMIDGARENNQHGNRVTYHLNSADDLKIFADDSFDFVFSLIVFQHMENRYKTKYLHELLRVVKPGGIIMFTIPSHASPASALGLAYLLLPNSLLNVYRKRHYGYDGVIELHPMRKSAVEQVVSDAGGTVVAAEPEPLAGSCWRSYSYVVRRD